ncbi:MULTISPECIES: hypothetical protein [Myxococcaceae]|uniref:hypothetical protein n=1 Tax=Myxococcaceae TaxID=31 RepID=UPI00188EFAB5|nr:MULTISPECIES: hypothetical protein [Myxococcaceae]MBF5045823.1 hypothetical protein [Simulacricoccus sp. 17bor-14]
MALTREGRALATRVHRHLGSLEARALAEVGPRDVQGFHAVLAALLAAGEAEETPKSDTRSPRRRP